MSQEELNDRPEEEGRKSELKEESRDSLEEQVSEQTLDVKENSSDSDHEIPETEKSQKEMNISTEEIGSKEQHSLDTTEDEDSDASNEDEGIDIESLDKQETIAQLKDIIRMQDVRQHRTVHKLKAHFDVLLKAEVDEAKEKFLADGNVEDDFEYKYGQDVANLNNLVTVYLKSVRQKFEEEEEIKKANLIKKNALLANLRDLCDEAESKDSFQKLKDIQANWKTVGPVPNKDSFEVNRSYGALLDIFYNNRKLFIELVELDKKKNLEQKEHLIERVELLEKQGFSGKTLSELNSIHDEFKNIGPVPKDDQDSIWERFKTASDKIYELKKKHLEELQNQWEQNFQVKSKVLEELVKLSDEAKAESVKQWQMLTEEVQKLADQWKKAGKVPNDKISEINKPFWNAYKTFFQKKSAFFKELDKERQERVKAKINLIEQAESLFNDDWEKNIDAIKKLQLEWKKTGIVSKAQQEKLFNRFKAACDQFFAKKKELSKIREEDEVNNLQLKEAICEELEKLDIGREDLKNYLSDVRSKWSEIGFVPFKQKENITKRYKKALDQIFEKAPVFKGEDAELRRFEMELANANDNAESTKLIQQKEFSIRKRIAQLESECQNIENNMMMFGKSNKANALLKQYEQEVERHKKQIEKAKDQLKKVKALGNQK